MTQRKLVIELLIAVTLCGSSAIWATRFWNSWTANGGQPAFYQSYFEPAVMVACGKGFAVSQPPRPALLTEFLEQRRDSLSCSDLPVDLQVGTDGLYQGAWIYLQTTIGWAWRVLGISWSRMGPLFGLLFGIVIALAYGIFRLGMGRVAAVICALGLASSYIHLANLPHLRDYAKAPFTLALVLILGVMVTTPVRRGWLIGLALAYGVALGIGYGFRTDFLVNLPLFPLVAFAFLDGGVTKNLRLKAGATAIFIATFAIVSWPATATVYTQGGCQWHVSMLGLSTPFDQPLHVAPAPYQFGYAYSDGYMAQSIYGYATRADPGSAPLQFCSHEYDVQSGRMFRALVTAFPGDIITRAYGAVLQIAELPFESWASPLAGWHTALYEWREAWLRPHIGAGVFVVAAALGFAGAASLRLGLFVLFVFAYFGGYPAIQFQQRHHFHLEFMTWFAAGFVVHSILTAAWSLRRRTPALAEVSQGIRRAVVFSAIAATLAVTALATARWYQRQQVVALLSRYVEAPKTPLDTGNGALPAIDPRAWPQLLEVDIDQSKCGPNPAVTFRYRSNATNSDLERTVTITRRTRAAGVTRIFQAVFVNYEGITFSDMRPGCVAGVYRVGGLDQFGVLLDATLPPNWKSSALYQRLADWESDPSRPPLSPLPDLTAWRAITGQPISVGLFGSATVVGDNTTSGYQMTSPRVDAPPGSRVFVRLSLEASRGKICVGALNGTTEKWLAAATPPPKEFNFTIDDSGGFMVAVSNCNSAETPSPSRFTIASASYAVE